MKTISLFMLLIMSLGVGAIAAPETHEPVEVQAGSNWLVTVTYNIYYSYYEEKNGSGLVAEGVYQKSESITFDVYAETQDEAETEAKSRCDKVCADIWGRYVGMRTYRGKSYHAFETRKVAMARATAK